MEQSKEGSGKTVLKGDESDYDGRYTNEVVKTMHEVRLDRKAEGIFIVCVFELTIASHGSQLS